jgi:hypothetical protein
MANPPSDYHICPSCGTEFGYDDAGRSYAELRTNWLRGGAKWWSPVDPQPDHWDGFVQVSNLLSGFSTILTASVAASDQPISTGLADMITGKAVRQGVSDIPDVLRRSNRSAQMEQG